MCRSYNKLYQSRIKNGENIVKDPIYTPIHSVAFTLWIIIQHQSDEWHYVYVLSREGYLNLQGVSRLVDITAGGDFLGICDQKSSYKHVSDFGRLRSYDRLKLRIEVNDY